MVDPLEAFYRNFVETHDENDVSNGYFNLYSGMDPEIVFAYFHQELDTEFSFMSTKAPRGESGHFNAENSRTLLRIIEELQDFKDVLAAKGKTLQVEPEYQRVIDSAKEWLMPTNGSVIPEGLTPVKLARYRAIFSVEEDSVVISPSRPVDLVQVGHGSFANVHKYRDPDYDVLIARKSLFRNSTEKECARFHREFEMMKSIDFPYILKVYAFNEGDSSYTMEHCDCTLGEYISRNNQYLSWGYRKKISLQFLYGLNHLHGRNILHRDLALSNVLMKLHHGGAFTIKISDFGLAKIPNSEMTKIGTEMKGHYRDPDLDEFKDFQAVHDIYGAGWILSYIFTGRQRLLVDSSPLSNVIRKCTHSDTSKRYQNVVTLIEDVKNLRPPKSGSR